MSEKRFDEIVDPTKMVGRTRGKPKTNHCGVSQCDRETKLYRK